MLFVTGGREADVVKSHCDLFDRCQFYEGKTKAKIPQTREKEVYCRRKKEASHPILLPISVFLEDIAAICRKCSSRLIEFLIFESLLTCGTRCPVRFQNLLFLALSFSTSISETLKTPDLLSINSDINVVTSSEIQAVVYKTQFLPL